MARFNTRGITSGAARAGEYLGDINESNQWNTLMDNLKSTAQYKSKRDQAEGLQSFLNERADTTDDPYLSDAYKISALGINPMLGEDVNVDKVAGYPYGLRKQQLAADAMMQRAMLSQGGQWGRQSQREIQDFVGGIDKLVNDPDKSDDLVYSALDPALYQEYTAAKENLKLTKDAYKQGAKPRKEAAELVQALKSKLNEQALTQAGFTDKKKIIAAKTLGLEIPRFGDPLSVAKDLVTKPTDTQAPAGYGFSSEINPKTIDSELLDEVVQRGIQQRFGY